MATNKEVDSVSGTETTGHEWDGIKELNTPLPRWWLTVFYACIAFAVGYWVLMPAWPTLHGYAHGLLNYSQRREVMAEVHQLQTQRQAEAADLNGDGALDLVVIGVPAISAAVAGLVHGGVRSQRAREPPDQADPAAVRV